METSSVTRYVESSWFSERVFTLGDDHLQFSARQRFGTIVEQRFPLAGLQPMPARMWVRDRSFETGFAWVAVAAILFVVIVPLLGRIGKHNPEAWLVVIWTVIAVVVAGIVGYVVFPRRIEYAMFHSTAGIAVLSVGRRGKHKSDFDGFVEELSQRIGAVS